MKEAEPTVNPPAPLIGPATSSPYLRCHLTGGVGAGTKQPRMKAPDQEQLVRRRGRQAGIAVFGVIVAGITAWWTSQILLQVWPSAPETATVECRPALRDLLVSVSVARKAAAEEVGGEQASLQAFRNSLASAWEKRPALDRACAGDARAEAMLRDIDELRYAEEHAVRYEAVRLSPERKRASAIAEELGGAAVGPN